MMSLYFKSHCDQCEKTNRARVFKMSKGNEFTSEECHHHYPKEDSRYTATILRLYFEKKNHTQKDSVLKRIALYFSLIRIKCTWQLPFFLKKGREKNTVSKACCSFQRWESKPKSRLLLGKKKRDYRGRREQGERKGRKEVRRGRELRWRRGCWVF